MPITGRRTTWARGRVLDFLSDTAALIRITEQDDGAGGFSRVESAPVTYPFRMQTTVPMTGARSGGEQTQADRIAVLSERVGFLPFGTVVQTTDILIHTGRRWEVIALVDDRSEGVLVGVLLKRVG